MRDLRRFAARVAFLFALPLLTGCALDEPYPPWPTPPPSALSPDDVVRLLLVGVREDDLLLAIRRDGISARPTAAELHRLRLVGASGLLLAGMFAAELHPVPLPPAAEEGVGLHLFPVPPLPGHWPIDVWLWLEGMLKALPQPAPPIEAQP